MSELDEDFLHRHVGATLGPHVELSVSDTGVGMDPATLIRAFEPFFTTKEQGKGTGLGLSTVYGIVKQSGGYVSIESQPRQGTQARVYLPRTVEPAAADLPPADAANVKGSGIVMLVEDEPSVRGLVTKTLQRAGYTVVAASDGPEAIRLAAARPEPIQLLLTDVVMPGMSGRQLADYLAGIRPGLRILFVSGYSEDAVSHHGVLDPGVAYLQKPFTPDQLIGKVQEVLNAKR